MITTREVAPTPDANQSPAPPGPALLAASREAQANLFNSPAIENARLLRLSGVASDRVHIGGDNPSKGIAGVIKQLIKEAVPLMASVDDFYNNANSRVSKGSKWSKKSTKTYSGIQKTGGNVTIDVELLTKKQQPRGQNVAETWACRRSYHDDLREAGTASWDEFYTFMKNEHVRTEVGMTDTVINGRTWATWDGARTMPPLGGIGLPGSEWTDITLAVVEMEHKVGSLLGNRVFPVVQVTCQNVPLHEIYVISAPINNWLEWPSPDGRAKLAEQPKTVVGSYASVEVFRRIPLPKPAAERPAAMRGKTLSRTTSSIRQSLRRKLSIKSPAPGDAPGELIDATGATTARAAPAGEVPAEASAATEPNSPAAPVVNTGAAGAATLGANPGGGAAGAVDAQASPEEVNAVPAYRIEWTMATVSDARGILPRVIQNPFVPGKIAEDVPMFTKWMLNNRADISNIQINDEGNLLGGEDDAPARGESRREGAVAVSPHGTVPPPKTIERQHQ